PSEPRRNRVGHADLSLVRLSDRAAGPAQSAGVARSAASAPRLHEAYRDGNNLSAAGVLFPGRLLFGQIDLHRLHHGPRRLRRGGERMASLARLGVLGTALALVLLGAGAGWAQQPP